MPKSPPGHALSVHNSAQWLEVFSSRWVWTVALIPPLWLILCISATWSAIQQATTPLHGPTLRQLLARWLGKLAAVATALGMVATIFLIGGQAPWLVILMPVIGVLLLWTLFFPVFGGFLTRVTRTGSALEARVRWLARRSALTTGVLMGLTAFLPDVLWGVDQLSVSTGTVVLGVAWLAVAAATVNLPRLWMQGLDAFWGTTRKGLGIDIREIRKAVQRLGLTTMDEPVGMSAEGETGGLRVKVRLDLAHAPGELFISVTGQRLSRHHGDLVIRGRSAGGEGLRLNDPVLDGALRVQAADGSTAASLCAGLHEELMPIFHPYTDARLASGRLTLRIHGPPFGSAEDSPGVGAFVADRIGECMALMAALEARSGATGQVRKRAVRQRERT